MTGTHRVVGIAELVIVRAPERAACLGLGSCVAVIMCDTESKIGGIVHVLLPKAPDKCDSEEKYADTGTKKLLKEMLVHGARKDRIVAKLVGGAQMFPGINLYVADIGRKNALEIRDTLRGLGIRIIAEELDGNRGRSAYLDPATGKVTVLTAFLPAKVI